MITLDATTKKIRAVVTETTTTPLSFYASYVEITSSTYVPSSNQGTLSSTGSTATTIVDVPSGASTYRIVKLITIVNLDNATRNIAIQLDVSGTVTNIIVVSLDAGEQLTYADGEGWNIHNVNGDLKISTAVGLNNISAGTTNITSGQIVFSNSNSISFGLNGNTLTVSTQPPIGSSYQNAGLFHGSQAVFPNQSTSIAVHFNVPYYLSLDYVRIPGSLTNSSNTMGTTAGITYSIRFLSTFNAAIYTIGTGTNGSNLYAIASGSAPWTIMMNSINVGTQGSNISYTQGVTGYARGSTFTTVSNFTTAQTNIPLYTSGICANISAGRYFDIPINSGANVLDPGEYWLVFGVSTSQETNNAGFVNATSGFVKTTGVYCNSMSNLSYSEIGQSNNSSSAVYGAASFTTNGVAGLTSPIPKSCFSTASSHPTLVFQLLASNIGVFIP